MTFQCQGIMVSSVPLRWFRRVNWYVMILVDYLTKGVYCIPLLLQTGKVIAKAVVYQVEGYNRTLIDVVRCSVGSRQKNGTNPTADCCENTFVDV
ncbi:hypothetical protein DPMN_141134 [Dreissena polymorpha]|uniref:Uncharacterized protein n=1 Tax=Dreissena polymorpha TaxID=45954 RepID=A0A9D4GC43_DREPO|nr:hypothetical protein DPMN_141134 [Dreissena polymorpha]